MGKLLHVDGKGEEAVGDGADVEREADACGAEACILVGGVSLHCV